jgi:type VI secretion system lysozyme-like protein
MADLTQKERLQPSLLDRLTDNDPERKQESRDARVLSPSRLRDCVRRDLAWLLNTTHLRAMQNLDEHPQVARSVLNYGMPDLAGRTTSGVDTTVLEQAIRKVILDFEPRLVASSGPSRCHCASSCAPPSTSKPAPSMSSISAAREGASAYLQKYGRIRPPIRAARVVAPR